MFRRLPAGNAPALIHRRAGSGVDIVELGCGAGRLCAALSDLGHAVTGVDTSAEMLACVRAGIVTELGDIANIDLGRTFGCVVLASYLVNHPTRAGEFLATCRRLVDPDGTVMVQRYDPDWARAAGPDEVTSGDVRIAVADFAHPDDGLRFAVTVTYSVDDRSWDQRIDAVILDDDALAAAASIAGLRVESWLDEYRTWAVLRPTSA
ncbi:MAG: hypothetical protein NVS3B21_19100 [Acidimicrobiales bacterium]